jgi:hypothetical protein
MLIPWLADIAILHDVVAAAQEQIDSSRGPKPLPAAALFRAYDEVLPRHGIDPDDDQHLSAFIFRIGGERGAGSLIEKFQAILGRMGIVLEFDNTNASVRTSPPPAPSSQGSPLRPVYQLPRHGGTDDTTVDYDDAEFQPPEPKAREKVSNSDSVAKDGDEAFDPGLEQALQLAKQAAISSAMSRWRDAAAQAKRNHGNRILAASLTRAAERGQHTVNEALSQPQIQDISKAHPEPVRQPIAADDIRSELPATAPTLRPSLLTLLNRWRTEQGNREEHKYEQDSTTTEHQRTSGDEVNVPTSEPDNVKGTKGLMSNQNQPYQPRPPSQSSQLPKHRLSPISEALMRTGELSVLQEEPAAQPSPPPPPQSDKPATPSRQTGSKVQRPRTEEEDAVEKAKEKRMMARAARAREIYLASKVFNHWADRTARRLEREAVARRHMIRFRCFHAWSQVPSSRDPAVEQLRVMTASQKLRRAVSDQDNQLREAAAIAAQSYRLKKMRQALDTWTSHLVADQTKHKIASRTRVESATKWLFRSREQAALRRTVSDGRQRADQVSALRIWRSTVETAVARSEAAEQIGLYHRSFAYLGNWWDQVEAERRAQTYKQVLSTEKVNHIFDQWNLQARAQAFIWRNEYSAVSRLFDHWHQETLLNKQRLDVAKASFEKRSKKKYFQHITRSSEEQHEMQRLQERAQYYIRATRLISVCEEAAARRRVRERQAVKKHLMIRYQQVSAARKRKNFFSALDTWRTATSEVLRQQELASQSNERYETKKQARFVEAWSEQATQNQIRHSQARLSSGQAWLALWSEATTDSEEQDMQAWGVWVSKKQRQYQKAWSMSSIRQSGRAHTAAVVAHRHEQERQQKTLQKWKSQAEREQGIQMEPSNQFSPPKPEASDHFRGSWRAGLASSLPRRRTAQKAFDSSTIDTPTRWTGHGRSLLMANLASARKMAPVRETVEEHTAPSSTAGEDEVEASPSKQKTKLSLPLDLPSTTPRAPVPAHLERELGTNATGLPFVRVSGTASSAYEDSMFQSAPTAPASGPRALYGTSTGRSTARLMPRPKPAQSVSFGGAGRESFGSSERAPPLRSRSVGPQPYGSRESDSHNMLLDKLSRKSVSQQRSAMSSFDTPIARRVNISGTYVGTGSRQRPSMPSHLG